MPSSTPTAPPPFPDTEPMSLGTGAPDADDPQFAPTQPLPLASTRPPAAARLDELSLAPLEVSLYEVMAEIRKDNRVCPQPTRWLEFYRILQEAGSGQPLPAPPLTGSAWAATPALAKRMCFREQVEWAAGNGCLQASYEFIKALPEGDWHYMG